MYIKKVISHSFIYCLTNSKYS